MLRAVRCSGKAIRALGNVSTSRARVVGAAAVPLLRASESSYQVKECDGFDGFSRTCVRSYSVFPGGPFGPQLPSKEGEGSPEDENKEDGGSSSHTPDDFYDLPKGPTHKEMIAARRHYLKRQARRGLLPPSRPIRKPSF